MGTACKKPGRDLVLTAESPRQLFQGPAYPFQRAPYASQPRPVASARPIVWPLLVSGHHRLTNSHFRYNARFHRLGILMALSRRRCSFHRLGILLALLGGASATTATFNFTSRAPSGILADDGWLQAGDPPEATRAPRLVDRWRGIPGAVTVPIHVYRRRGSDLSKNRRY